MDETWIYFYDPETKEQSEECRHSGLPCPKKFQTLKSARKVMASVLWDKDGIQLVSYFEKECNNHSQLLHPSLAKVKQALVSKKRGSYQKECCFSRTMPACTQLPLHS
jgi:hypothetical protein